jgi:Tol biopolymer transport system component
MRYCLFSALAFLSTICLAQSPELTVEKIMRDPKWIGTSPSNPQWSQDSRTLFFNWNPDRAMADSTYYITITDKAPRKSSYVFSRENTINRTYNRARTAFVFVKDNDIYYTNSKNETIRITHTADIESNPQFSNEEHWIVYTRAQNLYAWEKASGATIQLTNFKAGESPTRRFEMGRPNPQEKWLKEDQMKSFEVLRERKERTDSANAYRRSLPKAKELRTIDIEDKALQGLSMSPDARFVSYRLTKSIPASQAKNTIVPNYVTESGFTVDIPGRTKVGAQQSVSEYYFFDRARDTVIRLSVDSLEGIRDLPDYVKDYPKLKADLEKKNSPRDVFVFPPFWSPGGKNVVFDIRSLDNKDRWLVQWDTATGDLKLIDRQRDEAWIAGPGISFPRVGWIDENTFWFQSEVTGYSHLYTYQLTNGTKRAITSGNYEVQQASLSRDNKTFYITTNELHPGEQHFYHLDIADGKKTRITTMTGANQVTISPDQKYLAIIHSYSTRPWELYLVENKPNGKSQQITNLARTAEFQSYNWQDPELLSFPA